MSIVITLGVTTPETSYSDMAAGSDPESVEASPAVNEKNYNHSCGSAQNHVYRGLPYAMQQSSVVCCQDHNYGAPPPPTPPASPHSQTIISRMDLNGAVRSSRYHETTVDNSADSDSSSEEDGALSSWCHCSPTQDCLHIKCECRELDRRKGEESQSRKPENVSAGESSATESGDEEVSPATISYTATQHTPTSIKLTVNRVKSRKSKKRKKSTDKARGTLKVKKVKAFREGSRKSMRMKNSTAEASVLDENTAEGWESRIRQWTDQYEEAQANQYSADVQTLLQLHRSARSTVSKVESGTTTPPSATQVSADSMDTINRTELTCNNTVLGSQMQLQLGRVTRVQKHRKILRAAKNLEPDTLIIEYRGKVMLKQQFEVNGHFLKKPYPFVLFYSKFNHVEMCVDARTFGNDARFIRRSCTPNAEVRHVIAEGMIHLCIYAISQITKDSEVTIGFDYEFNNCKYKVDCACHKDNQNCPVQKHNLSSRESVLSSPSQVVLYPAVGTETRRRKAQRKELENCLVSSSTSDQQQETKDLQGTSDTEERTQDEIKGEEGEQGEAEENGIIVSNTRTLSLERRRRVEGAEVKNEGVEAEDGAGNPAENPSVVCSTGVGVSTRRTAHVTESPPLEKTSLPTLPAPVAPPKPVRPTKPRTKSRISRYRSSSTQRARRHRQTLAQQAAATAAAAAAAAAATASTQTSADHSAQDDEGSQGPYGVEHGLSNYGVRGGGHLLDGGSQSPNSVHRGSVHYPKTKKCLMTEWLNDKIPGGEKVPPEVPVERILRITTDPTVLATTLNMLPGHSHTSLICTTPRHYVRFGSPFNPERRRPRPLQMDGTYGCYKKRWIKQMEDESCSTSVEDGTESTSSQQSTSSRSTPNPLCSEVNAPFKKRHHKYMTEIAPAPSDHLLRPLSPITPPLPEDSPNPLLHTPCGSLLPNGLAYSPMPSLSASRCNTPLQFENISSPEASPLHRPESVSPEPSLQDDFDTSRPQFLDLSLHSSLESPGVVTSDDFSIPGVASGQDSQGQLSTGASSLNLAFCPSLDSQSREQAFRTEFNLIYTCSPLNANLGNPVGNDQYPSQVNEEFSPSDSLHSSISGQRLAGDLGSFSMSPYGDPHYGAGYTDSCAAVHTSNPPQKKKVSLLEYRKRKQGSGCNSEPTGSSTRAGSESYYKDPHPSQSHKQTLTLVSPHPSFPSSTHTRVPQMEEIGPSDHHGLSVKSKHQENNSQWMVPTTVERLREGQGALERVLRNIKMEQMCKKSVGPAVKESDSNRFEVPAGSMVSSTKSPHRYSPPVYTHQSTERHQQTDSPSLSHQTSNSPFQSSYSPSSGQSFYPRLSSSHPPNSYTSPATTLISDSRKPADSQHQQSGSSRLDGGLNYDTTHLNAGFMNSSSPMGAPTSELRTQAQAETDLSVLGSSGGQQQASRCLKASSSGQVELQASSRLQCAPGPTHYPQQVAGLGQFQHPPLQEPRLRTQSGSF